MSEYKRVYTEQDKLNARQYHLNVARDLATMKNIDDLNYQLNKWPYKVVFDPVPLEEGGYKPGAKIDGISIRMMTKIGSLKHGTILERVATGLRFIVVRSRQKDFYGQLKKLGDINGKRREYKIQNS